MQEITVNLHNHSSFSRGEQKYHSLAQAGLTAGIDALIVTDANVYVSGKEQYSTQIGRASCRKECRSRWSPYH